MTSNAPMTPKTAPAMEKGESGMASNVPGADGSELAALAAFRAQSVHALGVAFREVGIGRQRIGRPREIRPCCRGLAKRVVQLGDLFEDITIGHVSSRILALQG